MRLSDLLQFDGIVIQCHNDPDADAIASGFGVWRYLQAHGKRARLIYGGGRPIQKSNVTWMVEQLAIPMEYVTTLEERPQLLLTVDCQPGGKNVQSFPALQKVAIDHHPVDRDAPPDPALLGTDIRDDYGACATIIWTLLCGAGYDLGGDQSLATALYYGLFMDTCKFQDLYHITDRQMRDVLDPLCDGQLLDELKTRNISFEELRVVGRALADCRREERFTIAQAEPCDPNLLGIIADQMLETDGVDVCVAFCMLPGGAKISVRSCLQEARADDVANRLTGGGGHARKAGGFLPNGKLGCPSGDPAQRTGAAFRVLSEGLRNYFREQDILRVEDSCPDLSDEPLYRKKPLELGCLRAADVYPLGTKLKLRMLEGDRIEEVDGDLCLMTGVRHEVYPSSWQKLVRDNTVCDRPLALPERAAQGVDDAIGVLNGEDIPVAGCFRVCVPKGNRIRARQLARRTKVFPAGVAECMLGEPGDYLVAQADNLADVYIIKADVFSLTYERAEEQEAR